MLSKLRRYDDWCVLVHCSDVMCGQLHCTPTGQLDSFLSSMLYLTIDSHITVGPTRYECDSAIIDVGTQYTDPGLAPDGAKCGDGQVSSSLSSTSSPLRVSAVLSWFLKRTYGEIFGKDRSWNKKQSDIEHHLVYGLCKWVAKYHPLITCSIFFGNVFRVYDNFLCTVCYKRLK